MRGVVYGGSYRGVYIGAWSCVGGKTRGSDAGAVQSVERYDRGGHPRCGRKWRERWSTTGKATSRAAGGVATRPVRMFASSRNALDGDAEPVGLVDEVVGDARAWERDDALGQECEQVVVPPEGSGSSVCVPVGLADDLVDAVSLRPSRRYLLGARTAAVDEHHVCVLRLEPVEMPDDGAHIVRLLAARHGDECSLGEVRGVLAVLSCPLEVSRVDHGRGELAGLRDV